jgi:hypothetical protein
MCISFDMNNTRFAIVAFRLNQSKQGCKIIGLHFRGTFVTSSYKDVNNIHAKVSVAKGSDT